MRGLTELLEQPLTVVQILVTSCCATGNEVIRANIQSGEFVSVCLCQLRRLHGDWLSSFERIRHFVVVQR